MTKCIKKTPFFDFIDKKLQGVSRQASSIDKAIQSSGRVSIRPSAKLGLGLSLISGFALAAKMRQLQNDTRRKAIIEDLCNTDPILKGADKKEILTYYATIYNMAPLVSLDKPTVRELLQNFIKFGRVDMQTIKTLTETEKNRAQNGRTDMGIKELAGALI